MNPQNKAINKISAQAKKLLASISELALFTIIFKRKPMCFNRGINLVDNFV